MKNQKTIQLTVQAFINKGTKLQKERNELFHTLQEKTNSKSCSWYDLFQTLHKIDREEHLRLFKRYTELNAQIELISEFGSDLAYAGFWKQ